MKIKYIASKDWPEGAVVWQRRIKKSKGRRYRDDSKFAFCKTLYAGFASENIPPTK